MQNEFFKFHFPLSDFPSHHKISDLYPISRLGGDPVRTTLYNVGVVLYERLAKTELVEVALRK